jgi:hypothetical protein
VTAAGELQKYRRTLRARLERERRTPTAGEYAELRARWEAADAQRSGPVSAGGVTVFATPVPNWTDIEMEFGPAPEPEPTRVDAPGGLRVGRPRESPGADAEVRLRVELTRWLNNDGKPSLRGVHRRLKELGYEVSYRRVRETAQSMKAERRD